MKKIFSLILVFLCVLTGFLFPVNHVSSNDEKVDIIDHTKTNLLDCYAVLNKTNRPYPVNYGFKVGILNDGYEFVNADGTAKKAISGAFFTAFLPLTTNTSSILTSWEVSATVTGMARGDWGGYGIMFGQINGSPATFIINENGGYNVAINETEYAKSFAKNSNIEFSATGEYTFKVSVVNLNVTFTVNNIVIGTFDMSSYTGFEAASGPVFKNYTAHFEDFKLEALASDLEEKTSNITYYDGTTELTDLASTYVEGSEKDLATPSAKDGFRFDGWYSSSDFTGNKVTSISKSDKGDKVFYAKYTDTTSTELDIIDNNSNSLLDAYAIINSTYRPYPTGWGLRYGIINGGYEFVDNSGSAKNAMSGIYITTYLPLTKNTDNVTSWQVSATVTGMARGNWGGFGIMFGVNDNSPVAFIINESGGFTLSYGDNDFAQSYEAKTEIPFSATGTYNFTVTVSKEKLATLTVNNVKIADADLSSLTNLKACSGPALMNYTAHFTDFKLIVSKDEVEKEPENYIISYYDGDTELVSLRDTYLEGSQKTLKEPEYKDGYTFEGWYANSSLTGDKVTSILATDTGNKVFYAKYVSDSRTYIDVVDSEDTSILDSYSVTNASYRPYPSNYSIRFGKVDDGYEFVDSTGASRNPIDGTCMTTYIPLTKSTRYVTAWKASLTVKGIEKAGWGGYGMMFAKWNGAPVTFWITEASTFGVSYGNQQFAASYAANESVPFTKTGEYNFEVQVLNNVATLKVNNYVIGTLDLSSLTGIKACVGPMLSNYTAHFTNIKLLVDETEANRVPDTFTIKYYNGEEELTEYESTYTDGTSKSLVLIPDTSELLFEGWYTNPLLTGDKVLTITEEDSGNKIFYAKFSNAPERVNIIDKDDHSLLFGYSALSKMSGTSSAQPYPKAFSIMYQQKEDGYYLVGNNGETRKAVNGAYVAFPLPLVQKVSSRITDYTVNATFTLTDRAAFGGAGLLVGWYNGYAVCVTLNENSVIFTADLKENEKVFQIPSELTFNQNGTYEFRITVKDNNMNIIINNLYVGVVDLTKYAGIKPACGPAIKNYSAKYTNIELNILANEHKISEIKFYDGPVVITGIENAYDEGFENTLEDGPEKQGYSFEGWYQNPELTGDKVTTIDSSVTGTVKLYAKYVIDETYYKNIAKVYSEDELVTCVEVATDTITQYMQDIKFKNTDGIYSLVDANGESRVGDGMHIAGIIASPLDTTGITTWTASVDVTGVKKYAYGGFGLVFGWFKNKPACIAVHENNICISVGTTEIVTVYQYPAGVKFVETDTFRITAKVVDMVASFYVNGYYVAQMDLSSKVGMMPCIGGSLKNHSAVYTNFELFVSSSFDLPERTSEFAGVIVDPEVLDDFDSYENLIIDNYGLIEAYGVTEEFIDAQPFSVEFGINVGHINDYYTRVGNLMEPNNAVAFSASYIPTRYDVSKVFKYIVSADFKVTEKMNWGGMGLVIGRNNIPKSENYGAPIVVWISEENEDGKNVLTITYDFNEWTGNSFLLDEKYIEEGNNFSLAVIVEGYKVHIYINGEFYTSLVLYYCEDFAPTCGVAFKNWTGEVRNLTFKTNSENLSEPTWTITKMSSGVEIGSETYQYGDTPSLTEVTRKGYKFAGWHLLPDLSDARVTSIPTNAGGNINLYCEYVKEEYTITLYDGNTVISSSNIPSTYKYKTYVELVAVEKKGYKFVGWYDNANFEGEKIEEIMPSEYGNKVFYAKYEKTSGCSSIVSVSQVSVIFITLTFLFLFRKKKEEL